MIGDGGARTVTQTVVRTVAPERIGDWFGVVGAAFGAPGSPEEGEFWRSVMEPERMLGVVEPDGTIAATAGSFAFRMTVPGGREVAAAGVSNVAVLPTRRRRGLLTAVMREQLHRVYEDGREPVAVLTASEPRIYGRFGYGLAAWQATLDARRDPQALPAGVGVQARLELVDPAQWLLRCAALHASLRGGRSGHIARVGAWRKRPLLDPPATRDGATRLRCVVVGGDDPSGPVRGYAYFATRPCWGPSGPAGTVLVREVLAADPSAYAALWRFLFDLDLTERVVVENLPVDAPLLHLLADPRRARMSVRDGMFVRLVNLGEALSQRRWSTPVDVVVEVADDFCPWNAGRWRISGDQTGSVCERTGDPADLVLDTGTLAALYLGGVSARALAGAGRIEELRPGMVVRLDTAAHDGLAPWLVSGF